MNVLVCIQVSIQFDKVLNYLYSYFLVEALYIVTFLRQIDK